MKRLLPDIHAGRPDPAEQAVKRLLPDIAVGMTVLALCGLLTGAWLGPASWPAGGHSVAPAAVTAPEATR